jgi:hypothetical protein
VDGLTEGTDPSGAVARTRRLASVLRSPDRARATDRSPSGRPLDYVPMVLEYSLGHGNARCDRCFFAHATVEATCLANAAEAVRALGWAEPATPGVPGRWWCPACIALGPELRVPKRGKRTR